MIWFANFQTNYYKNKASVYFGYAEDLDNTNGFYFLNIENLFKRIISKSEKDKVHTIYFENLTYDGEFILWWLIKKNLKPLSAGRVTNNTFKEKNDNFGKKIEMYFIYENVRFDIICSKKVFNLTVEQMGELLNLENFNLKRKPKHKYINIDEVEQEIKDFSKKQVKILKSKYFEFSQYYKINKTASSTSWNDFKQWFFKTYSKKEWADRYYWTAELFDEFQLFYNGGICAVNNSYIDRDIKSDIVKLDINSSYPSIFKNNLLPYGKPLFTKPDSDYVEFVKAKIYNIRKKDKWMIDHLHNKALSVYHPELFINEYDDLMLVGYILEEWEEIKKTYDFDILTEKRIYFKADKKLSSYVDKIYNLKENEKNESIRFNHKLILNSLTGKFGQHYNKLNKHLVQSDNINQYDHYHYDFFEKNDFEIKYNPVAIWINALARVHLLKKIREIDKYFISCDTDSIICFKEAINNFEISKEIGKWKIEEEIKRIKILGPKFYIYKNKDNILKHKLSGIHKTKHHLYNFNNFNLGTKIKNGNIKVEKVEGGVKFTEFDITINKK